jgi:uncharacterized membrane protein YqjE
MASDDRSIAALLSDIVGDVQQIIRAEVRLAKVEVREELGKAKRAIAFLSIAGVIGLLALAFLLLAAVYALATVWPAWAAALAVSVGAALVGALLFFSGVRQLKTIHVVPPRTAATVQENVQWAKTPNR